MKVSIGIAVAAINDRIKRPDKIASLRGLAAEEFVPGGMLNAYKESERTVRELDKG